ncbi:MAG: hypothetical protein H6695_13355 [Deferribacteres bacterium]|nr:hypothetical protein [candidate division KSB1 bacterium]MCB9511172.1 hypothetical protein [Deferribacteres bacterium]
MANDSDSKLNSLINTIKEALQNLVTLEIITAVGQVDFNAPNGPDLDTEKDPKVILTKINLIQGDVKTVYDPEFITGNYRELKDFHKTREEMGHQMIKDNLDALMKLFNLAKDLRSKTDAEA